MSDSRPVGRFAPTPSGPLHFGSLIAATASYLNAKSQGGEWRLRIDDIDAPRVVPGACESIVRTLQAYGFEWDGDEVYQSERLALYQSALADLNQAGRLYVCECSRKMIQQRNSARPGQNDPRYDNFCRPQAVRPDVAAMTPASAWRFAVTPGDIAFQDAILGAQRLDIASDLGDFVVKRADGFMGYHLACAVDDLDMGVTEVVRGADLLHSSFPQLAILQGLGVSDQAWPQYAHHPLVTNAEGIKLSKKSRAPAIQQADAVDTLHAALRFLQHPPPKNLTRLTRLWDWAMKHWELSRLRTSTVD